MNTGMLVRLVVCFAVVACAGATGSWATPNAHMRPMIVSRNFDWFPDGERIAFESNLERPAPVAHAQRLDPDHRGLDIFVVRRDGTGLVNLTRDNPDRADTYPSVSPDGQWIAFLRRSDSSWHPRRDRRRRVRATRARERH